MSVISCIITLCLLITGRKPKMHRCCWYFEIGKNWGAVSFGQCVIISKEYKDSINHEYGHSIQNCIFGPLFPILIAIPSAVRCVYRGTYFADKNDVFEAIITTVMAVATFIIIACMFNMYATWMWAVLAICIYLTSIALWLTYVEGSRYTKNNYPLYDVIWFEGMATRLGNYFSK